MERIVGLAAAAVVLVVSLTAFPAFPTMVVAILALVALVGMTLRDRRRRSVEVEARDQQLRMVLDGLPVAVMLRAEDGTLLHLNPGARRYVARMGVGLPAVEDSPSGLLAHIEVIDEYGRPYAADDLPVVAAVRDGRSHDATLGYALPEGGHAWYNVRAAPVTLGDGTTGTVVTLDDVTRDHAARHRVAVAERSLRLTFEHAPIGIAVIAPEGRLLQVNAALCDLLGHQDPAELLAAGLEAATHPDEQASHAEWVAALFVGAPAPERVDRRLQHVAGHWIHTQVSVALVRDDDDTPLYLIAQVVDLTERRALEQELRTAATQDPLTGLVNRRALIDHLAAAQRRQERDGNDIGLLFVDLDDFKAVNDRHGHEVGDRLLVEVGRRMRAATRRTDTVCRMGGDEFAVLCTPVEGQAGLQELVDRLRARRPSVRVGEVDVSVGQSIGAIVVEPGEDLDAALRRADAGMYRQKRQRGPVASSHA